MRAAIAAILLALAPGLAQAQAQLRVIVSQGEWAAPLPRPPIVRVRGPHIDISRSAYDTLFVVPPGDYRVTTRVGARESMPTSVSVAEGGASELRIGLGSGRLQVAITRGRNLAFWDAPRLELRQGASVIRRGTGARSVFAAPVPGPQTVFDADPGVYTLRVMLPEAGQFVDIPNLRIAAAETNTMIVEAGAAELSVGWAPPQFDRGDGARPWAMVRILQRGRLLVERPGDPVMFLLLPGDYEVVALQAGREIARHSLTLAAGDTHTIAIGP
jgi:hypothetical protein